ncbi:MAG: glycosyltransferase [Thermosipho sp. (in: Bacteria)]|nr:glycosyltransferase [Thermosipho sp. (in: thermotogales)]
MKKVDVSIISLTWNSERYLESFLASLFADLENSGLKYEILIIDNGSKDKTKDILKSFSNKYPSKLVVIPLGKNMGTTFTRNIGIRMSTGEYIAILDSDTIISKNFFKNILNAFEKIPSKNIGIIHPKLVFPDGTFQESARRFPTLSTKILRLLDIEKLRTKNESIPEVLNNEIIPVDYAISAAWFLKKEIFEKVGLLDEAIFYAPEDAEFCARLWDNGYEVWYYPKVEIIHDAQRLTKKKPFSKLGLSHLNGLIRFWRKYKINLLREKVNFIRKSYLEN